MNIYLRELEGGKRPSALCTKPDRAGIVACTCTQHNHLATICTGPALNVGAYFHMVCNITSSVEETGVENHYLALSIEVTRRHAYPAGPVSFGPCNLMLQTYLVDFPIVL